MLITCLTFLFLTDLQAQAIFEPPPSQSMVMTGKGPGLDATINPLVTSLFFRKFSPQF